jgi:phosphate transport system substrate-binding protein
MNTNRYATLRSICLAAVCMQAALVFSQNVTGAGATFPAPAYARWAESYSQSSAVKVNYQPIGSSGGIKQIDSKTVDFGATDAPLKDDELAKKGQVQFPTLIGGVVPVVNVRGIEAGQLRLTGSVLADIYLGKVTRWTDPAIKALNPTLPLPDAQITPVFRTDGSGTTFIFTNYLSKVSPEWKNKAGEGANIAWPTGSGGRGNLGVAAVVSRIQNAIGYVEHAYVKQGRLKHALVQNAAGQYIEPSTESFRQASTGVDWASSSYQILTQQPAPQAWPITGASFVLLYAKHEKPEQAAQVLRFFHYGLTQGDKQVAELGYAPLPKEVVNLVEKQWSQVRDAAGQPIAFK